MIRFVLAMIVILGFGYLGILYSSGFKARVLMLEELKAMLSALEFNITFMNLPLYEAVLAASKNRSERVKRFLENAAFRMKHRTGEEETENIWRAAALESEALLQLKKEDIEIILEFSKNLGKGDKESEINNIHSAISRIEQNHNEALNFFRDNSKLYRSVGLAIGVFIAIILI